MGGSGLWRLDVMIIIHMVASVGGFGFFFREIDLRVRLGFQIYQIVSSSDRK